MRKPLRTIVVTFVAALALTACSDGGTAAPDDPPTPTETETPEVEEAEETEEVEETEAPVAEETEEAAASDMQPPDIAYATFIDQFRDRAGTAPSCDEATDALGGAVGPDSEASVFLVVGDEFASLSEFNGAPLVTFGTVESVQSGSVTETSREYLDTVWGSTPLVTVSGDGTCTDAGRTVSELISETLG